MRKLFTKGAGMIGMVCLLGGLLTSCVKDHNNYYVAPPVALVSAINASPDAQPVDFFLDQNRGNNFSIKSGESQDYIRAYTGKRTISFYVGASRQAIKSDTVTLKANKLYSVFLANQVSTPDLLIIADSVSQPAVGKFAVRFVNLSPDAGAADLAIKGGAVLASNIAYKHYSLFTPVTTGSNTNTYEVRKAGTTTVLYTLTDASFRANTINTIWLQGLAAATDVKKISAHTQENVIYY
ncbi:DUF4397 domain-containing protein [Mucilaginibacter flavus]|uniref:DUF4397 domain-containing protein n=1 Tax=Mucilaginibacter flavus TaxID=931504 RepID=UPI0025B5D831|nr:DUF4397 domain-containing protein [Mucilaginibacter flavus]MDN3582812.1 DUF4397 domain-containing protein [Mucilaginibacter flavus]